MTDFSTTPDYFNSREVIERIAELEGIETIDRDEDEQEELDALYALAEEAEGMVPDWEYGETFIREDEFTDYAEETLKDVGYLPAELPSWIVIDMEATADNMKEDYTEVTFRGVTYLARV